MRIFKKIIVFICLISLIVGLIGCSKPTDGEQGQPFVRGDTIDLTEAIKNEEKIVLKVGDLAIFGVYEQDDDRENGVERIEWIVLAVENDKALLLSEKILDSKGYNNEYAKVTWETCSLRAWLNDDFYNNSFSDAEKAIILLNDLDNESTYPSKVDGGNDTQDKIFLLSYKEVTNPAYGFNSDSSFKDPLRMAAGTAFAISEGLFVFPDWKENEDLGFNYWWLRSNGADQGHASIVRRDGSIFKKSYYVNYSYIGVRPAVWLSL